jgi:hypothetical protein
MTLAAEQGKQAQELVYRLRCEVGHRIEGDAWTQCDAPNTAVFWMDHLAEGTPSRVQECERATSTRVEYTPKASIAECQATAKTWFYDSADGKLYVQTTNGDSPAAAGAYYLRSRFWDCYCDKQYPAPREIVYGGAWCLPWLSADSIPDATLEVTPFSEGGVKQSFGSIAIFNGEGNFDSWLYDYIYCAAPAVLEVGSPGDDDADYTPIWRGWIGGVEWSDAGVVLHCESETAIAED